MILNCDLLVKCLKKIIELTTELYDARLLQNQNQAIFESICIKNWKQLMRTSFLSLNGWKGKEEVIMKFCE